MYKYHPLLNNKDNLSTALALPETTNSEVVTKTTAINTAIAVLIEVADLTTYNAALAAVVETDYTEARWTAYQIVVSANVVTIANTQTEVDTATVTIISAQDDLVLLIYSIDLLNGSSVSIIDGTVKLYDGYGYSTAYLSTDTQRPVNIVRTGNGYITNLQIEISEPSKFEL